MSTVGRSQTLALLATLVAVLSMTALASGQDARPYESVTESPRLFDADHAGTLRGTVVNVETIKPSAEAPDFVLVDLKVGNEVIAVHLGPRWFMDEQIHRIEFVRGSELEVTGTPNVVDGKKVFVAQEIRRPRGEERLRLRHQDGTPVWSGSERAS